jgi:hypothetical protein
MHFGNYVITSFRRDNRQINYQNLYQDRYQHVCRKKGKRVRINVLCNGTCHDICQMSRRTSCCQNVSYCLIAAGIKQSNVIQGGQFVGQHLKLWSKIGGFPHSGFVKEIYMEPVQYCFYPSKSQLCVKCLKPPCPCLAMVNPSQDGDVMGRIHICIITYLYLYVD